MSCLEGALWATPHSFLSAKHNNSENSMSRRPSSPQTCLWITLFHDHQRNAVTNRTNRYAYEAIHVLFQMILVQAVWFPWSWSHWKLIQSSLKAQVGDSYNLSCVTLFTLMRLAVRVAGCYRPNIPRLKFGDNPPRNLRFQGSNFKRKAVSTQY